MATAITIKVVDIVGSDLCVSASDGQKLFDRLQEYLLAKASVELSFAGVSALNSAFLNSAIGQLYGVYKADQLNQQLKYSSIEEDDSSLLNRVVESAIRYFADPSRYVNAQTKAADSDHGK